MPVKVKERVRKGSGAERREVKPVKKARRPSPFIVGRTTLRECARVSTEIFNDPQSDLERSVVQSFERLSPDRRRLIELELNGSVLSGLTSIERNLISRNKVDVERLIPGISPIKKQKPSLSVRVNDDVFFQLTKRNYFTLRTLMLSPQSNQLRLTGFLFELMLERPTGFYKLFKTSSVSRPKSLRKVA